MLSPVRSPSRRRGANRPRAGTQDQARRDRDLPRRLQRTTTRPQSGNRTRSRTRSEPTRTRRLGNAHNQRAIQTRSRTSTTSFASDHQVALKQPRSPKQNASPLPTHANPPLVSPGQNLLSRWPTSRQQPCFSRPTTNQTAATGSPNGTVNLAPRPSRDICRTDRSARRGGDVRLPGSTRGGISAATRWSQHFVSRVAEHRGSGVSVTL